MKNKKPPYYLFGLGIIFFVLSLILFIYLAWIFRGRSVVVTLLLVPLTLLVLGIALITTAAVRALSNKKNPVEQTAQSVNKSPARIQDKTKHPLKKIFLTISMVAALACLVASILIIVSSNTDVPDAGFVIIFAIFLFIPLTLIFSAISVWLIVSIKRASRHTTPVVASNEIKPEATPKTDVANGN